MHYAIRHITRFTYDAPIRESMMEIRMQPRTELTQRCLRFDLSTQPRAHVSSYTDLMGNTVHHFDIPSEHTELLVTAQAIVEFVGNGDLITPAPTTVETWADVDQAATTLDGWEMVRPSAFVRTTALLDAFAESVGIGREMDPAAAVMALSDAVHRSFEYKTHATRVDSPIDEALANRQGVCQDFAHVLLALLRRVGVPARYVSGYLFHARGERSAEGATHAWVEAWLPGSGWVGVDPTSNVLAGERHVRVAIGRDYADVAPTRGVYKGAAAGTLAVAVHVSRDDLPPASTKFAPVLTWTAPPPPSAPIQSDDQQQQQQQQQ
jgi:transglutaminase-like putative cysteine protease